MNLKTDQFYNDMLSIKKNKMTVEKYISDNFSEFWSSFYRYLSIYHQQIKLSIFSGKTKDFLSSCFEVIPQILQNANIEDYNESMKEDMTNCFKSMLHPDNVDVIKQKALEFFRIIYPRLKKSSINYTENFEQYFFDFSIIDPKLKITSISNEIRIQNFEPEIPLDFNVKIERFLTDIEKSYFVENINNDDVISWWKFIQKYIIGIIYYPIFKKKPEVQGISNIEKLKLETERIVIDFLIKISNSEVFTIVLPIDNTSDYIIDILCYISKENMISKINILSFINKVIELFLDPTPNSNIIEIIYNHNYYLLLELMGVLLNYLNFTFMSQKSELVTKITKLITGYFNYLFKLFNDEYKYELCSYISKCQQLTNRNCLLHFLTLFLSLFINNKVTDKKLWSTFVNSENSTDENLLLICYAYFSGYYSTFVFNSLIDLDSSKISNSFTSTEKLKVFLDVTNILWSNEFSFNLNQKYLEMFKDQRNKLVHASILNTLGINSIELQELFPNDHHSFPPKEELLQLLRAMFSSFVWQDKKYENDQKTQFNCYLVCASFITPLIKISNVIFADVEFGRNFLIKEFLTYLKTCLKPTVSNLWIKLHALVSLGSIICWKTSLIALDDYNLADWYLTLHDFIINGGDNKSDDENDKIKNDLKKKIKISALTFACRSILLGFKGSSILLNTIADNFSLLTQQTPELISTASTSKSPTDSFLIDEGYETLTSEETASLIVSLSNICEISNTFNFDCYRSNENNDIKTLKNELKMKIIKNVIKTVNPSLCASSIVSLLGEEAEANRYNSEFLDKLLSFLFAYFNNMSPENVYGSTTITLILPELEKVKNGSVALILDEALNALEKNEFTSKNDELLFGRFAEFVVDLLIYSSFIINTENQLKHFMKIVQTWDLNQDNHDQKDDHNALKKFQPETAQRLYYTVLSLSTHYLRFPPPTPGFSSTDEDDLFSKILFSSQSKTNMPTANFGSSKDCVIRVCDKEVSSLLPVGQFTWNFKSVAPPPKRRAVSDDVSIADKMPNVSSHPTQIAFNNRFMNFVDDLYSKHFIEIDGSNKSEENKSNKPENESNENENNNENKSNKTENNSNDNENNDENVSNDNENNTANINNNDDTDSEGNNNKSSDGMSEDSTVFEVFVKHLYQPKDFDSSSTPSLATDSIDEIKLSQENLPPHSVGPRAAAFMSTLNFFDSQDTNRLSPALQAYKNVEVSEFRHVIHVGIITAKSPEIDKKHFADFKVGLGLIDESKTTIITADTRHQIVFHPSKKHQKFEPNVYICWKEMENDEWARTFDHQKQKLRIEIQPTHLGLFRVSVYVNKNYYPSEFPCLSNVLVSKTNLPTFVISQILVNVHILGFKVNNIVRSQLQNGTEIRKKRLNEFQNFSLLMKCEQILLTNANSNYFSDDEE